MSGDQALLEYEEDTEVIGSEMPSPRLDARDINGAIAAAQPLIAHPAAFGSVDAHNLNPAPFTAGTGLSQGLQPWRDLAGPAAMDEELWIDFGSWFTQDSELAHGG